MILTMVLFQSAMAQTALPSSVTAPSLLIVFLAGMLSFITPCVLPLVPSYLAVLGGGSGKKPVTGALLFILGFTLVFISLGAGASALGSVLRQNKDVLAQIGGALILVFGIIFLVKDRIPALNREYRADLGNASKFGLVALGAAFAAGWTPCIGPILGVVLSIAGSSGSVGAGVGLLFVYAMGLGVPFLLAALAWDKLGSGLRKAMRWVGVIEKVSGVLLIVVGLLLLSGNYIEITRSLAALTPQWLLDFENGFLQR